MPVVEQKNTVISAVASKADTCPLIPAGQDKVGVTIAIDIVYSNGVNRPILRFNREHPSNKTRVTSIQ